MLNSSCWNSSLYRLINFGMQQSIIIIISSKYKYKRHTFGFLYETTKSRTRMIDMKKWAHFTKGRMDCANSRSYFPSFSSIYSSDSAQFDFPNAMAIIQCKHQNNSTALLLQYSTVFSYRFHDSMCYSDGKGFIRILLMIPNLLYQKYNILHFILLFLNSWLV